MTSEQSKVSQVTRVIRQQPWVYDCVVRTRHAVDGRRLNIAYVVGDGNLSLERLRESVAAAVDKSAAPDEYVAISAVPLTQTGDIDDEALNHCPVIGEATLREWGATLRATPGITDAAVLTMPAPVPDARVHLMDLRPDYCATTEDSAGSAVSVKARRENKAAAARPAISHGKPLRDPQSVSGTLQGALKRAAGVEGRGIIYVNAKGEEERQTYSSLLEDAERILTGLRKLGLKPGDKVLFQLERSQDFIPAFWGCVLGGFVPAPISIAPTYAEANATVQKLQFSWEMLDHALVVAGDAIAPEVRAAGKMLGLNGFRVADIGGLRNNPRDRDWHSSKPGDVCLILLTSGSTGKPKGVMQRHCSILTRSAGTAEMNGYDGRDVSLNWFPLDHVGGIVMFHIMDLYSCNEQIQVPTNAILQDPLLWLDLIDRYRATITWAPNFAYGLINDREAELRARSWDLASMRFILNGGEAIVAKTVRRFMELLSSHGLRADAMHPAWGMSETCSGVAFSDLCSRDSISDDDPFVEVGAPIPGVSFRIVDADDTLKNEGEIGRLQVKGPMVTIGYYNNEELNRESFSPDGWFNTGDLAVLRDGRLTITGRAKDVIIVNGVNFYSHEIESVVEEVPGVDVSFTAASATRVPGSNTDKVLIFFHALSDRWHEKVRIMRAVRSHLLQNMGLNVDFLLPVSREAIPKTAIGKIQRTQLRNQFEAGEFNDLLKEVDLNEGNARTLPNWFHRPCWTPRRIEDTGAIEPGAFLVFGPRQLAAELARTLERECIAVEAGDTYSKNADGTFTVDQSSELSYRQLLKDVGDFAGLIHAWNIETLPATSMTAVRQSQLRSTYSLLWLVHALSECNDQNRHLVVVTRNAQPVVPGDALAAEQATVTGMLKAIALEEGRLSCRHVDVGEVGVAELATIVAAELGASHAPEVGYRHGTRFVPAFAPLALAEMGSCPVLQHGGVYLITGGLGGVGVEVAKMLLEQYDAKLLVIGRTRIPERSERAGMTNSNRDGDQRLQALESLQSAGGEVLYEAVDVCNTAELQAAIEKAEHHFQRKLDGVFHLAGEFALEKHWKEADRHYVRSAARETFERMFAAKVYGTVSLLSVLKERSNTFFVAFSSVNSLFGGATFAAYSAANSFVDAATLDAASKRSAPTFVLNWTMWDNRGMSHNRPDFAAEASARLGFSLLERDQALHSLLGVLRRAPGQVAIGLDPTNPAIQRRMTGKTHPVTGAIACVVTEGSSVSALPNLHDMLGKRVNVESVTVAAIPHGEDGNVDRDRLAAVLHSEDQIRQLVAPRNEVEKQLAQIWCEVLRLPRVGVTQKLFDLGGDSLTAVRLVNRVSEAFEVDLPLRALFQMPSVAELAVGLTDLRRVDKQKKPAASTIDQQGASVLLNDLDRMSDEQVSAILDQLAREKAAGQ